MPKTYNTKTHLPLCPPRPGVDSYEWEGSHLYCALEYYFWDDEPHIYRVLPQIYRILYYLLFFAFVVYFFWATRRVIQLEEEQDIQLTKDAAYKRAWKCDRWPSIVGLVEAYLMGKISWAPWDGESIRARWPDKKPMKRFWRAGIIPLQIQPGGCGTYMKEGWKLWKWSFEFPRWVQSKQRASFVFIVPHYNGLKTSTHPEHDTARDKFTDLLLEQHEYPVSMSFYQGMHELVGHAMTDAMPGPEEYPLECGAESRFKYLLPFKKDRVLAKGLGKKTPHLDHYIFDPNSRLPLVSRQTHAVVHVEALDYCPHRLDLWIHECARTAGMTDIWTEDELGRQLGTILEATGLYTGSLW
jgi:hypothetical protein